MVESPRFRNLLLYLGQGHLTDDDIPRREHLSERIIEARKAEREQSRHNSRRKYVEYTHRWCVNFPSLIAWYFVDISRLCMTPCSSYSVHCPLTAILYYVSVFVYSTYLKKSTTSLHAGVPDVHGFDHRMSADITGSPEGQPLIQHSNKSDAQNRN